MKAAPATSRASGWQSRDTNTPASPRGTRLCPKAADADHALVNGSTGGRQVRAPEPPRDNRRLRPARPLGQGDSDAPGTTRFFASPGAAVLSSDSRTRHCGHWARPCTPPGNAWRACVDTAGLSVSAARRAFPATSHPVRRISDAGGAALVAWTRAGGASLRPPRAPPPVSPQPRRRRSDPHRRGRRRRQRRELPGVAVSTERGAAHVDAVSAVRGAVVGPLPHRRGGDRRGSMSRCGVRGSRSPCSAAARWPG